MYRINVYVNFFNRVVVEKKKWWFNDMYGKWLVDRQKFVLSPDIILCGSFDWAQISELTNSSAGSMAQSK